VFLYNLLSLERFRWEGQETLSAGKQSLVFALRHDGPVVAKDGAGALKVDDAEVASRSIPHTISFIMTIDETFDIGEDTRTPVDDEDYQVPLPLYRRDRKADGAARPVAIGRGRHQGHAQSLLAAKD
jgi:hypothetical protein